MRFVHLSTQSEISRIRQTGIRMGDGRRGKGVYAVPLALLEYRSFIDDAYEHTVLSSPRSSSKLWKWLPKQRKETAKVTAIVFELPLSGWPVDLYLELNSDTGKTLLERVDTLTDTGSAIALQNRAFVIETINQGFSCDLHFQAFTANALGAVFREYQRAESQPYDVFGESIEVVIRANIPKSSIKKVVAFYQRNLEAKSQRLSSRRKHQQPYDE